MILRGEGVVLFIIALNKKMKKNIKGMKKIDLKVIREVIQFRTNFLEHIYV